LHFSWDERKNRANPRKHGISFQTAVLVFEGPYHLSTQDREVEGELRWQTIGMVQGKQIPLVAHTLSESVHDVTEEVVRIIIGAKSDTPGAKHLCPRHLKPLVASARLPRP
jgi:uncharacterized protein